MNSVATTLIPRVFRLLALVAILGVPLVATAQDPAAQDAPPFGFGFSDPGSEGEQGLPVQVSAEFTTAKEGQPARLFVTATMDPGWHVYSLNQQPGGPVKTEIVLGSNSKAKLAGPFRPLTKPGVHLYEDIWPGLPVEEHEFKIVWFAPITIPEGIDPQTLTIQGAVEGQVCKESCIPIELPFVARLGKGVDVSTAPPARVASKKTTSAPPKLKGPTFTGKYRAENSAVSLRGQLLATEVAPGAKTTLFLTATPDANFHVYALADHDPRVVGAGKPTLIQFEHTGGLDVEQVTTGSKVHEESIELGKGKKVTQYYHEGPVSWSAVVRVPKDAAPGPHVISGIVGYQVCRENSCQFPEGARFQVTLNVGPHTDNSPLPVTFVKAKYGEAARFAVGEGTPKDSQTSIPGGGQTGAAEKNLASESESDAKPAGEEDAEKETLAWMLVLGFAGGMMLNVMPCVLPVIGLKLFAFIEQGGQSRWKTFSLNLWYSLGVISVFLVLAALAVAFGLGWGQLFQYAEFNIAMAGIIFAMGLSFLGIWEIPIPGFIGTSKVTEIGEREGVEGAFAKGTITTLLATPCTGPFMGTALVGLLARPAHEIFAIFFAIGLGMASPYLVIGAFPGLLRFLPKPGEWMNTFKQIMGFVLIGTVVYLLTYLQPQYVVPTVTLLCGMGIGCWWIGRVPAYASANARWKALGEGTTVATLIGLFAFLWLAPVMEYRIDKRIQLTVDREIESRIGENAQGYSVKNIPWQPYTEKKLEWLIQNDKTVLIDFTADWCQTCKVQEVTVLKTDNTAKLIEELNVYTLVADWTYKDKDSEVTKKLESLNSKQIPLLAIYSAGQSEKPILIPGTYTSAYLYGKLEEAAAATKALEETTRVSSAVRQ